MASAGSTHCVLCYIPLKQTSVSMPCAHNLCIGCAARHMNEVPYPHIRCPRCEGDNWIETSTQQVLRQAISAKTIAGGDGPSGTVVRFGPSRGQPIHPSSCSSLQSAPPLSTHRSTPQLRAPRQLLPHWSRDPSQFQSGLPSAPQTPQSAYTQPNQPVDAQFLLNPGAFQPNPSAFQPVQIASHLHSTDLSQSHFINGHQNTLLRKTPRHSFDSHSVQSTHSLPGALRNEHLCHCRAKNTVSFWCDTCSKLLCDDCAVIESSAKQHSVLPIHSAVMKAKPHIHSFITTLTNFCAQMCAQKDRLDGEERRHLGGIETAKAKLKEVIREAHQRLESMEFAIASKLDSSRATTVSSISKFRAELVGKVERLTLEVDAISEALHGDGVGILQPYAELEWREAQVAAAAAQYSMPEQPFVQKVLSIRLGDEVAEYPLTMLSDSRETRDTRETMDTRNTRNTKNTRTHARSRESLGTIIASSSPAVGSSNVGWGNAITPAHPTQFYGEDLRDLDSRVKDMLPWNRHMEKSGVHQAVNRLDEAASISQSEPVTAPLPLSSTLTVAELKGSVSSPKSLELNDPLSEPYDEHIENGRDENPEST